MKRFRIGSWIFVSILTVSVAGAARAQAPPPEPPPAVVEPPPPEESAPEAEVPPETAPPRVVRREVVRFGSDYTLPAGEIVREVVVISGSAVILGEVERDLVVIGGAAELAGTGSVGGDFVVIGGNLTVRPGAAVDGDMVVIGGAVNAPPDFIPGGEQVLAGPGMVGDWLGSFIPWVSRGLAWGRLIVPDLPWMWAVVGVFLAIYLALNLVFDRPVRACVETLARKPLTTFLVGLAALLLVGPVSFLLAVSVVGIAIMPFLWAAVALAGLLGAVAVCRWIGEMLVRPAEPESRLLAARSLVLGFAVISLAFMTPILGFVSWASLGVLGLGAAAMSVAEGLRGENPAPAAPPPPPPPPVDLAGAAGVAAGGAATDSAASPGAPPAGPAPAVADMALFPRATFLARLGAFVLDFLLVAMTYGLLDLSSGGRFFVLLLAYHIGFWAWKGTTVGGIICQLRVVRLDGRTPGFTDALVRGLGSIFSAAVVGLGFLWILFDPERQSWHDKIAGTCVVKVPRNWPLP